MRDQLDQIRAGSLDGGFSGATIGRLTVVLRNERRAVDDAGLGAALDAIELRAAVELAKRQQR